MLSRALVASARRALLKQAKRADHHAPANPGPPVTLDLMPVPSQSYAKVHAELQGKFNAYLAISFGLLATSLGAAVYTDLWVSEQTAPPKSWRERK